MEEQREIVMFLRSRVDEMDALIQKKEQFLAELETYKKSLIYESCHIHIVFAAISPSRQILYPTSDSDMNIFTFFCLLDVAKFSSCFSK